jgi:hypothetical protein
MSCARRIAGGAVVTVLALACCSRAFAYRPFDGTDAAVAEPGQVEIELITTETGRLLVLGLPCLLLGTLAGWSLYGKLNEAAFRKVVLWLLLGSGIALIATVR